MGTGSGVLAHACAARGAEVLAVDGGRYGAEVIRRFLAELPDRLDSGAAALILLSSRNQPSRLFGEFPDIRFEPVKARPSSSKS